MNNLALPAALDHAWARGCPHCKFGIVSAPDIVPALPLHEGRAAQCAEDLLLFCDCRAGHLYRQNLRKLYNAMAMGTRMNLREHVMAAATPEIHGEPS